MPVSRMQENVRSHIRMGERINQKAREEKAKKMSLSVSERSLKGIRGKIKT